MKFHADCIACLMQSALKKASGVQDEARKLEYMQRVALALNQTDADYHAAPLLDAKIIQLGREVLGIEEDMTATKRQYNQLVLGIYDRLHARVQVAENPLLAAVQLAMSANYIDFNVLSDIDPEKTMKILEEASERPVDMAEFARFAEDLQAGGELIYLHDNCGEVVLDKLLLETIHALYPDLKLISVVRGGPTANDATLEDAAEVGLSEVAEVISNGLPDVPGTQLDQIDPAVRQRIESARLVISKGQGNFETLIGCGLNIYYLLLSKCPSYTNWFGFEHFAGVFKNEQRLGF